MERDNIGRVELKQDYIYKLKILVMGDRGVGKSTMIYTYLNEHAPKNILPKQDLNFYSKKEIYVPARYKKTNKLSEREETQAQQTFCCECRVHLWDISGSIIDKQTLTKFKTDKFFEDVSAFIYIFKDQKSFNFLSKVIMPNLPRLEMNSQIGQYMVYNQFKDKIKPSLKEEAQKLALKEKILFTSKKLLDQQQVSELFTIIRDKQMFKVEDGTVTNAYLKDRRNQIVLRDCGTKKEDHFQKRYNRCC